MPFDHSQMSPRRMIFKFEFSFVTASKNEISFCLPVMQVLGMAANKGATLNYYEEEQEAGMLFHSTRSGSL